MNKLIQTTKSFVQEHSYMLSAVTAAVAMNVGTFAMADDLVNDVMKGIVTIICNIVRIVGIIVALAGLVKYAMAHANKQGSEQHEAIQMMAAGAVMVILPSIIEGLSFWKNIATYTLGG